MKFWPFKKKEPEVPQVGEDRKILIDVSMKAFQAIITDRMNIRAAVDAAISSSAAILHLCKDDTTREYIEREYPGFVSAMHTWSNEGMSADYSHLIHAPDPTKFSALIDQDVVEKNTGDMLMRNFGDYLSSESMIDLVKVVEAKMKDKRNKRESLESFETELIQARREARKYKLGCKKIGDPDDIENAEEAILKADAEHYLFMKMSGQLPE